MSVPGLSEHVHDPGRLAALHSVALLDTPTEEAFDRLSRLAIRLLRAPVALVSLVDSDRQFFKSCVGLRAEPWSTDRETPLSHSFCQHNRVAGHPLVVEDARTHPLFKENLAVRDLDVVAYLGFPLTTQDGYVLGSFCAIDNKPRQWDADDVEIIRDLAAAVMVEIQLRTEMATRHQVEGERDDLTALNTQLREEVVARKQAEDQQQALESQLLQTRKIEAVGQLAGGIAHDLNNLLAPILIYTSILTDEESLADQHREIINQIQDVAMKARDLIRQLLAFSRMQAMEFKVHDLNHIVDNLQTLLRHTISENIQISVDLAAEPEMILADANQIEQIIMNLVVNAADAMSAGGELRIETSAGMLGHLDLSQNPEAKPGYFATLTISDNGTGMSAATQEHLFEPFFSTKGANGTGLGLATVMGIVLQHGGVVQCASKIDQGTTFRVHIPVTDQARAELVVEEAPADVAAGTGTVLLAEDHEQVRAVVQLVLRRSGYTVLSASNADDALAILSAHGEPIDLLITDVVMPGMDGRQLFEAVQDIQPNAKVLYMSGYSHDIITNHGVLESGIEFIAKPFLEAELLAKMAALMTRP